jgi:hypothetical protein
MRNVFLFAALWCAAFSVAAQQQPPPEKPPAAEKKDPNLEKRLRAEGAAGGTAPVPEQQRKSVGAGAKPHLHDDRLDRGLHRRSDAEVIAPSK